MVGPGNQVVTVGELQKAGVKRISMGVALYTHAMGALKNAAGQLASGDIAWATTGMSFGDASTLIAVAQAGRR